ncbi:MAG TPA: hypothetical protein VF475_17505 [Sphingobium sp.]
MRISKTLRGTSRSVLFFGIFVLAPTLSVLEGRASAQAIASNGVGTPFELSFWESVAGSNDRAQLDAYLTQYPTGTFSGLARAKLSALPAPAVPAVSQAPVQVAAATAPAAPLPAPVAIPAASPATAPLAIAPASAPSLLEQLAVVGQAGPSSKTALFTVAGPVPPRPQLATLAPVTLPDHFCSATERNSFHDTVYVPAVAQADRNNEATIAHLRDLQTLHAQALAANNVPGANALAQEAIAFKPFADQSYEARTALSGTFARIMATPITGC